jgi:hypothetical protein
MSHEGQDVPAAESACTAVAPPARRQLDAIGREDPRRPVVEAFVADVYRRHYDAEIPQFAPTLLATCANGVLAAAAGYRCADEPLYLEHYLDVPVERAIAAHAGHCVRRRDIVEIGHFASTHPGEGRRMMLPIARHLASLGYRWAVTTATSELRALMLRVGLTPLALAPADPTRVPGGGARWGRYYQHAPVVVAGDLHRALAALARRQA